MAELNQRRHHHKANDVKVAEMMEGRLLELEQNRIRDEERDKLQELYDEFLQDVEQRQGVQECVYHFRVFCGYMRLSSENED